MSKSLLVLIHRVYKNAIVKKGGADYIVSFLKAQGSKVILIEHPLYGSGNVRIVNTAGVISTIRLFGSGPVRWVQEFLFNVFFAFLSNQRAELILAVDPLNFLSAYVIKSFKRGTKILFHSIDYSEKRFNVKALDVVYNALYKFSVAKADVVTYVSPLMGKKILSLVPDFEGRVLFYLPNSPEYEKAIRINIELKNKTDLVYTKSFLSDTEVDILMQVIKRVKINVPNISLSITGNISTQAKAKIEEADLRDNVDLCGLVEYAENLKIISKSYIGLAWYENKIAFEKYADSLKLREYAAAGIPVICNEKISTAEEMQKAHAGFVATTPVKMADSIIKLLSDDVLYKKCRQNALNWARSKDKSQLLRALFMEMAAKIH